MIDKSGWSKVKLGDVVQHVKDIVNIETCDLEYYLGGEHFNTDDLHINGKGVIEGSTIGPAFIMRFKPGQVLLVSRNPHLRKMAVVDFEGICSNVTYVCETKSELLLQEFLPFVMRSGDFWRFAESNKRGSTNFYLNWTDFARYEFFLPPIEEQERISKLLWAADHILQKHILVKENLKLVKESLLFKYFDNNKIKKFLPIGNVLEMCQYGLSLPLVVEAKYPVFRMMNIENGKIVANDLKYINLDEENFKKYCLKKDDILFNRTNSTELVGKVGIFKLEGDYVFASYLIRLRAKQDIIIPDILNYILNMSIYQQRIRAFISFGVSQSNINAQNLKKVNVPILPIHVQKELFHKMKFIEESECRINESIQDNFETLTSLINFYSGGAN